MNSGFMFNLKRETSPLRIGNTQAFWGDSLFATHNLLEQDPHLDYLTLDYLAEVSLSILAIQKEKDSSLGYARDFLEVLRSIIPFWQRGYKIKVVTNAGGLNPLKGALACQQILKDSRCYKKIGVVLGDDILQEIKADPHNPLFNNLDTNQSLNSILPKLVSANAYLGAQPITEALKKGADIVITGRCTDPSLTLGPCMAHFGWDFHDCDKIAAGTVAGHLIECGTQVTGGTSTHWLDIPEKANIGFPIIEMNPDGTFIITKPERSGGAVTIETVKEQLLYEIGDPARYLSPDVVASFLSLELHEVAKNRILITGAKGSSPTATYKVSAAYEEGFRTEGTLAIMGPDARKKGKMCGEVLLKRLENRGITFERFCIECLGTGDLVPGLFESLEANRECLLRIAVAGSKKEALEIFSKEFASLVTSGPQGTTGYLSGRPQIRSCFGFWPCLIESSRINPKVHILEDI